MGSDVSIPLPFARTCKVIPDEIAKLSWTLDPSERRRYRELGLDAARVLESVCREIRPGMTEREVASKIVQRA